MVFLVLGQHRIKIVRYGFHSLSISCYLEGNVIDISCKKTFEFRRSNTQMVRSQPFYSGPNGVKIYSMGMN